MHNRIARATEERIVRFPAARSAAGAEGHGKEGVPPKAAGTPKSLAAVASPHAALCRSRRNWKNSTPSRSRRFIICGLRTISPTMEAIFGARK